MKINKIYKIIVYFLIFLSTGSFIFFLEARESTNPNVILITIDALRPDHLGCYGYKRNVSPNIDKLHYLAPLFIAG